MQDIGLFWQLTIKTIDDLRVVGNENLTLEMFIMQLAHLKNIGFKEEGTLKIDASVKEKDNFLETKGNDENGYSNLTSQAKSQLKNTNQIKTSPVKKVSSQSEKTKIEILSFQDLINQANKDKEIELKYDLERNVKLVNFNKGSIDISFNERLNKNFIKTLTEKLLQWTGERWIISLSKNSGAKSLYEKELENMSEKIHEFKKSKIAKEIEIAFPDAELTELKEEE